MLNLLSSALTVTGITNKKVTIKSPINIIILPDILFGLIIRISPLLFLYNTEYLHQIQ